MPESNPTAHRNILRDIARRVMTARGLEPDFSAAALSELAAITHAADGSGEAPRDLRALLWCSIDNDDSRDLDQLSVAEALPDGTTRVLVAVADVAALVRPGTALDAHAQKNTTSVYTVAEIFPMLPEQLSTDLTSLNLAQDRLAIVIEMIVTKEGEVQRSDLYAARVRNQAKLAYSRVAQWLDTPGSTGVSSVPGLEDNIRLQLQVAVQLKAARHARGALSFETVQTRPVFVDGQLQDLQEDPKNRAKELIEDLMVAANGATARFFESKKLPSLRRVVRNPKHWDRIMELAAQHHTVLPPTADAKALEKFLVAQKAANPTGFADLSLSVIKLMGAGEYVVEIPGSPAGGHFGLAVKDYAHSTAPNRRYPDLITQRLLKAAMGGQPPPYAVPELTALAAHCTSQEDVAKKVERQLVKSAAALLLQSQIGQSFDALVTGAAEKGTWVRISRPLVEGKLVQGFAGRRVGDRLRVQLTATNVERGLIDFRAV
jgi:VacB/RNase II family 3'-5' exoribonuclease